MRRSWNKCACKKPENKKRTPRNNIRQKPKKNSPPSISFFMKKQECPKSMAEKVHFNQKEAKGFLYLLIWENIICVMFNKI
jgi:hypothetical protein